MLSTAKLQPHLSDHPYVIGIIGLSIGLLVLQIVQYLRNPLRHIPGPWLARIAHLPLFVQSFTGTRVGWIIKQHKRYGPVIRIAPNKVCVASSEGVRAIYSNKAIKSSAYEGFKYHDVKMCIGLRDVKSAHTRRKGLLPAFSHQNLMEMEPIIRLHLEKFLKWLEKFDHTGEYVDCFKWFRYLTFDVVADIAFGQQIGMLDQEDDNFIRNVEYRNKRNGLAGPFPFIIPLLKILSPQTARNWINADDEIAKYAIQARDGWSRAERDHRPRVDILARLEEAAVKNPKEALLSDEIIAEMMEILNAGSDTTANTAMFASYELATRPDVQQKLYEELLEAFPDASEPLTFAKLSQLPFLDGVCREALRIHAPIPSYLERLSPEDGLTIEGTFIPEGTIVGMQAYTNHRNPNVYHNPLRFWPERWFNPSAEMKLNFLPFSAGPRSCIGLNLGNMQLRIHLGHIFRMYEVVCAPQTTPEAMSHVEFFTIRPKNGKCDLYFRKRK
ncbi:uncharacterized protein Z519_11049 [Cladophialophora bantiana CBS 173.52]|uniref:Cytochrome P450 oxidoreductase n=1 Tax=Cladophialophora bantiana (strain ATCC 10958 / CBS 173.52 / CDC B-1940 / NIH 8579) TaxID=1442370 RepID=A0A0D2HC37_CLAB1|nr:uncharacterized protein Z519_11049 [Cladophialophora bantiana CBS 173.52]KIW88480.1 hypothetical protein Z519_11049 [Cladophialophora bantiana CBS 173.52]